MTNELALVNPSWETFQQIMSLTAHADKKPEVIQAMLVQEIQHMEALISVNDQLQGCTPESVVYAIKSSLKWNLTLDPSAGLVYLKSRFQSVKNMQTGQTAKVKNMEIMRTANGEISYCRQTGRIFDIERPVIVKDEAGKVIKASVKILKPTAGGFRWETVPYDHHDFMKWQIASHKEKSRNKEDAATKWYCNQLYMSYNGGPDPEFIAAKVIRHALKKLGANQNEAVKIMDTSAFTNMVDTAADIAATEDAEFTVQ